MADTDRPRNPCPGPVGRRDFLRLGLAGLGGLTLPDLLRLRAEAPARPRRDTALLVVWLHGGASHMETYDPKPLAPVEYRGPYRPIATCVPGMRVSELLHEMGKPTIAMVNGVAAGAGLSLALAADMRFAGKSARMTTAFAKVGFSGDFGSHYFLHKLVGTAKARELYFTAEILNAEQIERLGLANRVVDDANLDSETMAFAKKLAAGPRVAWWHVKKNMKVAEEGSLAEALDSEANRMIRTGETQDHKEAARAFVEKRAPVFKGY